jgi:hypothetical protein
VKFFVSLFLFLSAVLTFAGDLPNPQLTPGATNPSVSQENIDETICVSGWTKTIRPAASYTNQLKKKQIGEYGYENKDPKAYEEDHLISLQLGGDPRNPKNLWPQPYAGPCGARVKDVLETKLKRLVCIGEISLEEAQTAIANDWVAAYNQYVKPLECQ